jgi:hypothetical protein
MTKSTALQYSSPVDAVFLRRLAWEEHVAKRTPKVGDALRYVNDVRNELGLAPFGPRGTSGGGDAFVQDLRKRNLIQQERATASVTDKKWELEWRLLRAPTHGMVRSLAADPVWQANAKEDGCQRFRFRVRDPAVPELEVFAGTVPELRATCARARGVYFLGTAGGMYLGKTDEFETRGFAHALKKSPTWAVFIRLVEDHQFLTLDSLNATEGLLISFWMEVAAVGNGNRGSDQMPAFAYLQQGVLFALGAAAALLWLHARDDVAGVRIPFKRWRGRNWPDCYVPRVMG